MSREIHCSFSCAQEVVGDKLFLVWATVNGRQGKFLIDSGSTKNFLSLRFVKEKKLLPCTKSVEGETCVRFGDGTVRQYPNRMVRVTVKVGAQMKDTVCFQVINLHQVDGVLGIPWLTQVNPEIDWTQRRMFVCGRSGPRREIRMLQDTDFDLPAVTEGGEIIVEQITQ